MAITELPLPAASVAEAADVCAHCGLPIPTDLGNSGAAAFCCSGCATAYSVIHEHGLERYYALAERRGAAVQPAQRAFEEFDHPAFHGLYVRRRADGLVETDLYLEGVHCSSCVWLIERAPLALPGVASAELNVPRGLVRVAWDGERTPLSKIARFLDVLGYRAHPFRGVKADAMRRAEDRAMIAHIGIAGAIAINVMLAALALYSGWLDGMEAAYQNYFRWVSLVLTTPALLFPGRVFFRGAWAALRTRTLHMDLPIALALGAGYARGAVNTITGRGPIYLDGVALLIFLLLVGRFLQIRAQRAAADSAELLTSMSPSTARVVDDAGDAHEVPAEALLPGMTLEARPGDTLAADGRVTAGRSELDVSLLSGESRPVTVGPGDRVFAGTVNRSSPIRVRVEQTGEASRLGRILRQVEEGAARRAPVVRLADRLAGRFVAVVLVLAAFTALWWLWRDPAVALDNAIALLIVTCPCALALATPLAVTVAIGRAARSGILIKGGDALEKLGRPARLILDKTGTVTEGRTSLAAWEGPDDVKPLVLGLERHSAHPIAAGFAAAWPNVPAAIASDVTQTLGGGLEGVVSGRRVVVGSPRFVAARISGSAHAAADAPIAEDAAPRAGPLWARLGDDGSPSALGAQAGGDGSPDTLRAKTGDDGSPDARSLTPVWVAVDGRLMARAGFGDPLRSDALDAVTSLRHRGWRLSMLSGDHPDVVEDVARRLGFAPGQYRGGASPEDKLRAVEAETAAGTVVMVGDGVNDAAAIARASVGVGVRGGAEACLAAADVFLVRPGLDPLVRLVEGAERTLRVIRRNIAFSLVYNVVGVGLAMTGVINPLIAAILMPVSSLTVILTSWTARTFEERPR